MKIEELMEIIQGRRSVRRFEDKPVDRELLLKVIEAAEWAPSASNRQDWLFTVITSPQIKHEMAELVRSRWEEIIEANRDLGFIEEIEQYSKMFGNFEKAPVVVVVSARRADVLWKKMLGEDATATTGRAASAAMAAQNLMLAAHAQGLATCPMTGALGARNEINRMLNLGKRMEIVCLIALGWPAGTPDPPERKPVEEITRFVE